ncbi:Small subunit (SSU) processome component [Acarospora aff. strigata]|nr:Small subunit (SSU) processome component [Acarospora aff. strigata]
MDMQTSDGRAIQDGRYLSSQVLAAVTSDGIVELFPRPFEGFDHVQSSSNPANLKAQRQQMTRKKEATVKIIRPDKSSTVVNVINADFQGADLVMVWTEGGVNVLFERVRWQDEDTGELLLRGTKEIVRGKSGSGLGATVMNGVKDLGKSKVDDSQAVVVNGGDLEDVPMTGQDHEVIEVSSGEDDISEGEGGHGEEADQAASNQDKEMKDAQQDGNEVEGEEQATFGDLLWAAAPGAVDVSAAFDDAESKAVVQSSTNRSLQLPTGMSLGTVLTQSLKTNDTNLLETCLHTKDLGMIRATIERLESALAAALLQKLAERLHSRPGRAGNLMVWIQWTLICHGGYLAGQPELMKKLSSLHRVVKERASSLQPLLSLKGKLDMLEAQMNLRRSMQANARAAHAIDEDDEEGVIYVEGQDDSDSEADSVEVQSEREVSGYRRPGRAITVTGHESQDASNIDEDEEDSDDDDNMPTTLNGVIPDSEEDDDSGSEADLIDDEASETGEDSGDDLSDDEVDHEDVDSVDGDNASDIDSPPAKRIIKPQLENGVRTKK